MTVDAIVKALIEKRNAAYKLNFNDLAILPDKKTAYGSSAGFNGLFEIALESGKCNYIGMFPNEGVSQEHIHLSAAYCQQKAFFFPQRGNYISVYDIEHQNIIQIDFEKCDYPRYNRNSKIGQVFVHKNKVFAVGATYPYVLIINADTLETSFIPIETDDRPIFFRVGGCQARGRHYIPSLNGGIILEIDPETESVKSHFWGTQEDGAWSMTFDGERFWLTPHADGEGFRIWEPGNGIVREIADFPEEYQAGKVPYTHCFYLDGEIIYTPFDANMTVKVVTKEKKVKKVEQGIFQGGKLIGIFFHVDSYVFARIRMEGEGEYAQTYKNFFIDMRTMEHKEYDFVFCGNREQYSRDATEEIKKLPFWNKVMGESERFGLEEFLTVL